MIKLIAAIDSLGGIADDTGIPWSIPSDSEYYKKVISASGKVLMGYNTYLNHEETITSKTEYVVTSHTEPLRAGFVPVSDIETFLTQTPYIWVVGGSGVFKEAIPLADYLYITQVEGDFNCTKFFPKFGDDFEMIRSSKILTENGYKYQYQIWQNKKSAWQNKPIPV